MVLTVTNKCPPEMKPWAALGVIHPLFLNFKVQLLSINNEGSSETWNRGWIASQEITLILL